MTIAQIIAVLIMIESGGNPNPPAGDQGRAVGILQIHPVMVREVNRIAKEPRYTTNDRHDQRRSMEMAAIFLCRQLRRKPNATPRELAMSWNSGSIDKPSTNDYRRKVARRMAL